MSLKSPKPNSIQVISLNCCHWTCLQLRYSWLIDSHSAPQTATKLPGSGSGSCPWCWMKATDGTTSMYWLYILSSVSFQISFFFLNMNWTVAKKKSRKIRWKRIIFAPHLKCCFNLLGTLLIALRGRSTLTVLMAVKLTFCRSSEYSTILQKDTQSIQKNSLTKSEWN